MTAASGRPCVTSAGRTAESGRSVFDDLLESQRFRDFLVTKNGVETFLLVGHDNEASTRSSDRTLVLGEVGVL